MAQADDDDDKYRLREGETHYSRDLRVGYNCRNCGGAGVDSTGETCEDCAGPFPKPSGMSISQWKDYLTRLSDSENQTKTSLEDVVFWADEDGTQRSERRPSPISPLPSPHLQQCDQCWGSAQDLTGETCKACAGTGSLLGAEEVQGVYRHNPNWRDSIEMAEPMEIAFQLLKERKSPEAWANKKRYDSEYQKTPKRVKYREQLNAERRKRGIYGRGGKDVSHTQGGKLTLESAHANRARHFKNRGTLRNVKKSAVGVANNFSMGRTCPSCGRPGVFRVFKPRCVYCGWEQQ